MKDTKKISLAQQCHDKTQSGFTLVTVLLLSSLASILVLTSLKDNITQERLSGNYQKKVNARLVSERGVFEYRKAALLYLDNNKTATLADLKAALGTLEDDGKLTGTKYKVTAKIDSVSGDLVLESTGNRYEGEQKLKARFKLTSGGGGSPFANAIVGCEGVTLTGSGQIDSYDSSDTSTFSTTTTGEPPVSAFDKITTVGKKGDVSTINQDADVYLKGNSPVYGNVNSTGKITLGGSSPVYGTLHANDFISINQGEVKGNVLTRGNLRVVGGDIKGYVKVNGSTETDEHGNVVFVGIIQRKWNGDAKTNPDGSLQRSDFNVEMGQGAKISNTAFDGSGIPHKDITYGGTGEFEDGQNNSHYGNAEYQGSPNVPPVKQHDPSNPDTSDPATNCDHLDITAKVDLIDNSASNLPIFDETNGCCNIFTFTETGGSYTTHESSSSTSFSSVTETVLGEQKKVIKFASFNLGGSVDIVISGDVTLFVEGGVTTSGSSQITIKKDSSLTIFTQGKMNLGAGGNIIAEEHGLTSKGYPAMSIYSSYESIDDTDTGINISGRFTIYAQIYAPKAVIDIPGSGVLYGAVRGKVVNVSGNGRIHYDAALGKADRGGSGGGVTTRSSIKFEGFEY
ncbi:MAG: polymer-forming cytoskeletal protein [Alteromonadales bacterium]|nr:polymer-forming cytoskeletal protein [Alteromonadales bacterium]